MLIDRFNLDILKKFLRCGILLTSTIFILAMFFRLQLPSEYEIESLISNAPVQKETTRQPFSIDHRGTRYEITPLADYEFWGMVVSHNNINAFSDIYHDENSVDIKDICVIWGNNTEGEIYKEVDFHNEPWSCRWEYDSERAYSKFDISQISNNHLVASDSDILQKISEVNVGDQVYLSGMLVKYSPENEDWERVSSLTREDTWMGACEVVFVEKINTIKKANREWNLAYKWSKTAFWNFLLAAVLIFFFEVFLADYIKSKWHSSRETEVGQKGSD